MASIAKVEGNRLGPTIFHHGQGLIVPCRGSGGLIPGRAARGDRMGRWPVERGPGMFVFVVSFAPDTVSRLLLLRLSLPLLCVSSRSRCPALRTSASNCFSQQLPFPSLHTARRSWNDHNSIGVLKALIGAVSRV